MAGQKAKAATAYEAALQYFNTGLKLLNPESWQSEYDLTLVLYSEAAGAAYLYGNFAEMEQFVEVVLDRAKTVLDKVQVYDSRIQRFLSQGNLKEALKIGLEVLKLLGVILIETPSQLDVQKELEETSALLAGREIEDLINLPRMNAPEPIAAIYILASLGGAALMVSPALMILMACKMVNLSINCGNATWSPVSYAAYGLVLCGVVQDIERGYQFGQLALSLSERLNTKKGNAKALTVSGSQIIHWKVHFRKAIPILVEAYQNGVETGDFEFAGYSAYHACYYSFTVGEELTQLEQKTATYSKAVGQIRRETPSSWIAVLWQTILNLLGRSENPSRLIGCVYDEEQALSHAIAVEDGTGIHYFYLNKVILCYLFGEYQQAARTAVLARQYLEEVTAAMAVPIFHFYDSLVLLSLFTEASSSENSAWLSCVNTNQEKMQKWAGHAPMNYLHKFHLVEAEKARVLGQFLEAEEFYERAIAGAAENEFIQEEALAYELAAKHYLARGREKIAQTYMKEAHYCYERWGAAAKVKDLETRYPQFFSQSSKVASTSIPTPSKTASNTSPIAFDLAAAMKASQAISREVELEPLLRSLMQILTQSAGAQAGYLILEDSGEWFVEASYELNDGENLYATQVLRSTPIANQLPESIIQYVIRTQDTVTLSNASREGIFINESYIQRNQTQSVLCLPLLNQGKLVGVLYLENQLAAGAFTPERSQILHFLSTQAAIAIENAKLYSQLRASKNELTQFFEAVPVGIGVVDATGRPYYCNQRAIQLLGKGIVPTATPDQLAEVYQIYVAGTDQPYPTEKMAIARALSGERTMIDDMEIRRDNVAMPVEVWGTPVFDEQGNVAYAIATFQDITQRKQAEAALRESEARYRLLFENNPSPMWIYDTQTLMFIAVNDVAVQYYGYSLNEFLTMTILDIRSSTDAARLRNHMDHVRSLPYTHSGEWQHHKKDGTVIDVEITSRAIAWSGVSARCVLVKDITERKRAEQLLADYNQTLEQQVTERTLELEREQAALRRSEATNRAIISAIPDLLIQMSQDGTYLQVMRSGNFQPFNPKLLKAGVNVRDVLPLSLAQTRLEYTQQAIQTGELQIYEQKIIGDDRVYDQEVRIVTTGEDTVLVMIRDIRDRKQAEEASILEERNRMAREIHDTLAQTLTGVLVHMGAISRLAKTNPEATQSHIQTVRDLARSGLTEARRSVAALRPQLLEEGNLWTALEQFVSSMQFSTETRLICEIIGTPYALPPGTENNLLRIGQEAFTNAVKYAYANEIWIELVYEPTQCCLRIRDDGQGFEVNNTTLSQGFGLLGMCERAKHIGAQLSIDSQLGQGTEVSVSVHREAVV